MGVIGIWTGPQPKSPLIIKKRKKEKRQIYIKSIKINLPNFQRHWHEFTALHLRRRVNTNSQLQLQFNKHFAFANSWIVQPPMSLEDESFELRELQTLEGHTDRVWNVAWKPAAGVDGVPAVLASCSGDKTVRIWEQSPSSGSFQCKVWLQVFKI